MAAAVGEEEEVKAETKLGAAPPTGDNDFAIVKDGCVRVCPSDDPTFAQTTAQTNHIHHP